MDVVRGIGFDLDHTLAIDNRLERVALLRLLERMLLQGGRSVGTLADEIEGIDRLLSRQRGGEFDIDEAVARFAAEHGVVDPSLAAFFRATADGLVDELVVSLPGVAPTLAALQRRGVAVAVLSNGWNPLQRRKARRAGFAGPVLVSAEIGERKPQPAAFERLLGVLGTPAHESWYVGDDPLGDVAGAQGAGLRAVWLNWEGRAYPAGLAAPQRTIAAFDELLDLLPQGAASR